MVEEDKKNEQVDGELEECRKQAEEYLNNWKRERADFANYKKDENQRLDRAREFGRQVVIEDILDAKDDLDKIASSVDPNDDYIVAVKMILSKINRLFDRYKVVKIKVDSGFDPTVHEAIEMEPGGEQLQEVRSGYTINGELLRPAKVKIIK